MDDFAETLWHEFANETEEHLNLVEPILARAGPEPASADDIAQLFRSFHSIKGLSRAMDLRGMEIVAHRAEDILGVVRDGKAALEGQIVDRLLESVDALGQLRVKVLEKRKNVQAPKSLVKRLDELFATIGGARAAITADAEAAGAETAAVPAANTDFHENMDMVAIYVEMMRDRLAELALLLSPTIADPAVRAQVQDAASSLGHGANVMGFEQLGANFQALEAKVPAAEGAVLDGDQRAETIELLAALSVQAQTLAELSGIDAGQAALAEALARVLGDDGLLRIAQAGEQLEALTDAADRAGTAAALAQSCRHLHAALHGLGRPRADRLALTLESVFEGLANGGATSSPELIEATRRVLDALVPVFQSSDSKADLDEADEDLLQGAVRAALVTGDGAAMPEGQLSLAITPGLREILSADNVTELGEALASGQNLYELLIDFEADPAVASALLSWLSDGVRAITNRTILKDGLSWFEFLILAPLDGTALKDKLLDLDANLACVKAARRVTESEEGEILLGEAGLDAAESKAAGTGAAGGGEAQQASMVLRVSGETLDRFMTQIGEARVIATSLAQAIEDSGLAETLAALRRLAAQLPPETGDELARHVQKLDEQHRQIRQAEQRIDGALARLHSGALDLRVVPIDTILNQFPRVVRDLAQAIGKKIHLQLEGRDVKVDKSTVQLLVDPLMHMVRNSADHGIEPPEERTARGKPEMATILMRATQRGNEVLVEVGDDGRGLNTDAILKKAIARGLVDRSAGDRLSVEEICRFILQPGFSTAEKITETSGRGVGMDVVYSSVVKLGGEIEIKTKPGQGASLILHLPLSAALQTALLVEVGGQSLAIPDRAVTAVADVSRDEIRMIGHQRTVLRQGQLMPIYRLGQLLRFGNTAAVERSSFPMVIVSSGPHAIGLEVDRLRRRQELFLKDLHPKLAAFPAIGGASVMGDGRVVLVLDADGLIQLARRGVARDMSPPAGQAVS